MSLKPYQEAVAAWHVKTFGHPPTAAIGLKLGEEAGELMKAVNRMEHLDEITLAHHDNLAEELGDVAIVLMMLATRYNFDFQELVEHRVHVVTTRPRKGDV